ncbi:MAG TPA: hypothetical protein VFB52_11885 [Solirubrobacterales bacterium]|nr:hypothetical protein [Solirubrobacterales bacterium]
MLSAQGARPPAGGSIAEQPELVHLRELLETLAANAAEPAG